ncbi:MAG TPA: DUF2911 domain-containing protein [Terriglobales bacterium]|nr:DUF2911 domain-containing protein [Terriglobales bacterium]
MKRRTAILTFVVLTIAVTIAACQENKSKRPSPSAQAQCKFSDGKTITSDYSSPRMNGRKIFGSLVPYGQVWRTGANEATTLVTDANLTVDGKDVPAGSYTIFTIPDKDKWTLIVSKKTTEWGIPYPEGEDLTRADMKVAKTSSPVENFTMGFDQTGGNCTLQISWENTMASAEFAEKK